MDIRRYILAAERTYSYRIKAALPLEDAQMSKIERVILKYDPISITNPRKTLFQKNPLDFPQVQNAEIYIVDVELSLPASGYVLAKDIAKALGVADKFVVVRGDNDPIELENQRLAAAAEMQDEADQKGMTPAAALSDPDYTEAAPTPDLYGAKYNRAFLDYLGQVQKEQDAARKVDAPNPLFTWLQMPKADATAGDYNADVKATEAADGQTGVADPAPAGNLDQDKTTFRRLFKSKAGKATLMTKDAESIRKGK